MWRGFKMKTFVLAGIAVLLALPTSAASQSEPEEAEEPSAVMEEVIVYGPQSLVSLKLEMYTAEDALYSLFNELNTDDELDLRCYSVAPTGSKIPRRDCKTNYYREKSAHETQRMMRGEPYSMPDIELKEINDRLTEAMMKIAAENPQMMDAINSLDQAKKTWESEREERCEGRWLICRDQ